MSRYIDADKIIYHLKDIMECFADDMYEADNIRQVEYGTYLGLLSAKYFVETAETADVQEVKHGHWIEDKEAGSLICSECGHFTDEIIGDFIHADEEISDTLSIAKGTVIHMSMNPIYCSRCGAKMDEEEQK